VTGSGKAYLLRNGSMTEVVWSRPTAKDPTRWTLADGSEAHFQPGQVWFFLTDQEPEFSFPPKKSGS
jgi:hypothetical protein